MARTLVVTPEKLREGYWTCNTRAWVFSERRKYVVIRRLRDGNWLVEDPYGS